MIIAPLIDTSGSLYNYLQKVNATFFGPMLAVILLGFLTRHVSALAAKLSLLLGPVIFYLLVFSFGEEVQLALKSAFQLQDDVHFLHFLALVFVLTVLLMLLVSHFRPGEKIYQPAYSHDVDITPWKLAPAAGLAISIITIAFYVFLAQ
jgi:SSS family solute:Na+ symporter